MPNRVAALIGVLLLASAALVAQSDGLRSALLGSAKKIYGDEAPSAITFKTLGPADSSVAERLGGKRAGTALGTDGQGPQGRTRQPGDTVTGVVLQEGGDQVYVDSAPCNGEVMVFTKPYRQTKVATPAKCGEKEFQRFRFVQEKPVEP